MGQVYTLKGGVLQKVPLPEKPYLPPIKKLPGRRYDRGCWCVPWRDTFVFAGRLLAAQKFLTKASGICTEPLKTTASFAIPFSKRLALKNELSPGARDKIIEKDGFTISSEKKDVDIDVLREMLGQSYWAKNQTRDEVEVSVENSLCFSLLEGQDLIGFARVLTDKMAYAIILDMIIKDEFRI